MKVENQGSQSKSQGEGTKITKAPKFDLVLSLTALTLILIVALCFFVLGIGLNPAAQLAFITLPMAFAPSMLIVPASLLFGTWQIVNHRERYSSRQKALRKYLLITILLLSIFYPFWCTCLPVYGIRFGVTLTGGVDELQSWAVHILDMPLDEVVDEEAAKHDHYIVRTDLYSEQMRTISPIQVSIIISEDEEPYLNIPLAGGFFPGWGIRVGRPGFRLKDREGIWVSRWADGVYGFSCH